MKISISTAIIGGTDTVKEIPEQTMPYTHLLYTAPYPGTEDMNPRNQALYYKTQVNTLSDDDLFIWIDGKIQILSSDFVQQCIDALGNNHIAILKHGERKCIYDEVAYIEKQIRARNSYLVTRYAHRPIRAQVEFYKSLGYPANNGLNDCSIFIIRAGKMDWVFNEWWKCCSEQDWFDQTAIQFLCWQAYQEINPIVFTPGTFKLVNHIK